MSIFSETFPDFVKSELTNRQLDISSNRSSKGNVKIYFDKVTFDRVVEKLKSIKSD